MRSSSPHRPGTSRSRIPRFLPAARPSILLQALVLLGILLFPVASVARSAPIIDGRFSDWDAPLATDPAGDSIGPIDVRSLSVASAGTVLYARLELATPLNLSSGPTGETSLILTISNPGAGKSLAIDFRGRTARINGALVSWPSIDFACLPTVASTSFELRVNLASIGAAPLTQLSLQFSGADSLGAPVQFTLLTPPAPAVLRPTDRSPCALLRVASLNTWFSGMIDPARAPAIARLLRAANADVYVFQEEYDSTLADAHAFFASADPKQDGIPWNVVRQGELIVASQWPLIPAPLNGSHFGAVVRVPGGPDVFVATLHPKCCGYITSAEDVQRISQATSAAGAFSQFRAGTLSPALAPYRNAPFVLAGDWNLVGSATPLDIWRNTHGLTRAQLPHAGASDYWTWSSPSGLDFWPGELDVVVYDRSRFFAKRIFTLNSSAMTAGQLASLGLLASDSLASDHLLMISDFSLYADADLDASASVDDADFSIFAHAYNLLDCADPAMPAGCPADLNFDGVVDDVDFTLFVPSYDALICP